MTLTSATIARLCAIALDAGREIMDVYRTDFVSIQKDDKSPLTEADLRADRVIRAGLECTFPGVFILSEESSSAGAQVAGEQFFLVDPLDGTKEFLKRNGEFTVNIALIESGVPVAGVVYAPALDELFYAAQGTGAWKRASSGKPEAIGDLRRATNAPLRIIGSRTHGGEELSCWLAKLQSPHTFVAAGSSLKFCRLAEGAADIYPRLGPTSQWDTAAGQAVLEAAGGAVLDAARADLRYGLHRPILNPDFVALATRGLPYPPLR